MKKIKKILSALLIICLLSSLLIIPSSAKPYDDCYNETETNDEYYEANILYNDFTMYGSIEVGEIPRDCYCFQLFNTSKVTISCVSKFETLIGGILDGDNYELLYVLNESKLENSYGDGIVVTLPAGKYYLLLGDRNEYNYYKNDYTFYFGYEDPEPTLVYEYGEWRCVIGDYYSDMTGLVKYNGKWFYVEDGYWNKTTTDLIKYSGKWFYIKNGKWDSSYTNKLVSHNGKKFYIKNGKWDSKITDVVKIGSTSYYIKNGKWSKTTTLYKKNGKYYAIKSGKVTKSKVIIKYKGKKYYCYKGYAQTKFSGRVTVSGKKYTVKKGIVK